MLARHRDDYGQIVRVHHAVVTGADLHDIGTVGIDAALMRLADIVPGEQVSVWNINNGRRIETSAIALTEESGAVIVNGAAARLFPTDRIIAVAFAVTDELVTPQMIVVDDRNRFVKQLTGT
jgi:aspartate 1-decarboxylase